MSGHRGSSHSSPLELIVAIVVLIFLALTRGRA